jgi:hypothetical protein
LTRRQRSPLRPNSGYAILRLTQVRCSISRTGSRRERNRDRELRAPQNPGDLAIHLGQKDRIRRLLRRAAERTPVRCPPAAPHLRGPRHRRRSLGSAAVAAFRVVVRKLSVDFRIGQASRPCFGLELGDGLGEGARTGARRSTRLTRRPTASRLRASVSATAALGSTGMVTSTVLFMWSSSK